MFSRYAIFYTPTSSSFADFCTSWLGWDSRTGQLKSHPVIQGLDVDALTKTPRRYGIHGTLKAPFHLAQGRSVDDLVIAFKDFTDSRKQIILDQMTVQYDRGFVALRPVGDTVALRAFAADIVAYFDPFRAPAKQSELARRRRAPLTESQDSNLTRWGYPYVMDDFHFHMTLSGKAGPDLGQSVINILDEQLTPLVPAPFHLDHLSLMGQDATGFFHELHRYPLIG